VRTRSLREVRRDRYSVYLLLCSLVDYPILDDGVTARRTSYRAFKTVIGFKANPTDVRAIAPAIRFPGTDSLTNADPDPVPLPFPVLDVGVEVEVRGARVWN
jgi:hypothetical protein